MIDLKWRPYLKGRLIADHPDGYFIIKPEVESVAIPLFCPVCEYVMNTQYDEECYKKFTCCDKCASKWAYPNAELWNSGWRPSIEDIQSAVNGRTT